MSIGGHNDTCSICAAGGKCNWRMAAEREALSSSCDECAALRAKLVKAEKQTETALDILEIDREEKRAIKKRLAEAEVRAKDERVLADRLAKAMVNYMDHCECVCDSCPKHVEASEA